MRKLRLNYIAYLDPFVYGGGAELIYRQLIEHGRVRGHDIRVSARRWGRASMFLGSRIDLHREPDLTILADLWNVPNRPWRLDMRLIERVVASGRYVHIAGAWVDLCRRPDFPCGGCPERCPDACGRDRARWLYRNAIAGFFHSPLHRDRTIQVLGDGVLKNARLIYPCIDTNRFYNKHRERDIEYLYVGVISNYKGYQNIKQQFGHRRDFVFVGRNVTGEKLFGEHWGVLPQAQLPDLYNRAKRFVHLPEWVEPGGRGVVEAALCGCELVTNEKVGAMSFDMDISDPSEIRKSPDSFWDDIQCLV